MEKHAVSVILGIYDRREVKKMQIMDFGPSINTIDALLKTLTDEGITAMREEMQGRRVFFISLTDKHEKAGLPRYGGLVNSDKIGERKRSG